MTEVRVTRKGAERLAAGHVWIYASDVTGKAEPGAIVIVAEPNGRPLGVAHYSSTSQIALRMLSRDNTPFDFNARLDAAQRHRDRVVSGTDAYRLVHAEGDQLPALIIDRYADSFTVQLLDQGMDRLRDDIVAALLAKYSPRSIILRNDSPVRAKENLPVETTVAHGEPTPVAVRMNGLTFHADLLHGQKTGIFLDQRENYIAAARHAHGRALDCFTSTGGFALHLAARCESVEAIDSAEAALTTARQNAAANNIANIEWIEANAFDLLAAYASQQRRYRTIILDPPAFAKSRATLAAAIRGYKEINLRALRMLDRGGILVTCSCSYHLSEASLLDLVAAAALDAGRTLRVLERRTQAQDHPILLTVPETHYLKCVILEVI